MDFNKKKSNIMMLLMICFPHFLYVYATFILGKQLEKLGYFFTSSMRSVIEITDTTHAISLNFIFLWPNKWRCMIVTIKACRHSLGMFLLKKCVLIDFLKVISEFHKLKKEVYKWRREHDSIQNMHL